jgi:hypothetical protein
MRPAFRRVRWPANDEAPGFFCRLVIDADSALEAAQQRWWIYSRKSWHALTLLSDRLWRAGRPILFLVALCLAAALALAPVDGVLGAMFLLAGSAALIAFACLARHRVPVDSTES